MAFALSLAITLVLAAGVIAGRDRLFAASASDPTPHAPAATTILSGNEGAPAVTTSGVAPRVIEIPLPAAQREAAPTTSAGSERRGDDDHDERSHSDANDEHEEGDDD
jgi:hypothetical protein